MAFSRSSSVSFFIFLLFAVLINPAISSRASSFIKLPVAVHEPVSSSVRNCESWRLSVETNNAGSWEVVPLECVSYLEIYYSDKGQFEEDYKEVARSALDFARTVELGTDGKDAWVFDIDETLLSNLEYYKEHGYGSEKFDQINFNKWIEKRDATTFDASFELYEELKKLGFAIILLTGRDEAQREITLETLHRAGYFGWEHLLLRSTEDKGKAAAEFKSEQRSRMVKEGGFKLHGNIGDQWSDLQGFALADRSFKVPNPMYHIA